MPMGITIDSPTIADLETLPDSAIVTIRVAAYCRMMSASLSGNALVAAIESERYVACDHVLSERER